MAVSIGGEFGDVSIDTGRIYERDLRLCLLKSAWKHVYDGLNIDRLSSPADKDQWRRALESPAPFTLDNIRGTFGKFILDPRGNILRGLAEVFCGLDQAYKSHDKVKIGVAGLPKRVVLHGFGNYSSSGRDRVGVILNALACYQNKPLVSHRELVALMNDENALLTRREFPATRYEQAGETPGRGVRLRHFKNGNGHLFFEPDTLRDINRALAEFYGEVLPDTTDEKPTKKQASTAVSKDLQYYPTARAVVDAVLDRFASLEGKRILEPSCGCGRFMDALRKRGARPFGIEVDATRAAHTRARGHSVLTANFLESRPSAEFDMVVMNPPFYATHYAKHVRHAVDFLRPGGTLVAVLPVTARHHGLLDDLIPKPRWSCDSAWSDLPVGSFSESGTNINTTVLTIHKPKDPK
jgi:SAM-dependent methyltransferase